MTGVLMSRLVVVHVAVDLWSDSDLRGSVIGAWSTPDDGPGPIDAHAMIAVVREALGAQWTPATVAQIEEWHRAFSADPSVPWEQISLF